MQSQFIYFRADKTSRKQVHLIALIEILLTTYREEKKSTSISCQLIPTIEAADLTKMGTDR